MRSKIFLGVVLFCGLIVLPGYFVDIPLFSSLSQVLLKWAMILAGVVLIIGMVNLARVHWLKIAGRQSGYAYSLVLLVSLIVSLVIGLVNKPTGPYSLWIFSYIIVPAETSLIAILAVLLIYTVARMPVKRAGGFSLLFMGVVILMLAGMITLTSTDIPYLAVVQNWIGQIGALGGMRGLLLGVALGVIAAGLRIFLGAERPYER
jgi:hypothetical protein